MNPIVDDRALWAAVGGALSERISPAIPPGTVRDLLAQWTGVTAYATSRGGDPAAARAGELRQLFAVSGAEPLQQLAVLDPEDPQTVDILLAEAGRILADGVRSAAGLMAPQAVTPLLARQVLRLSLRWFDEDVQTAAPLLQVFTGHGADDVQAPAQAPSSTISRLEDWFAERVGCPVTIEQATVISGGFSRLMLDVQWSGTDISGRCVVRIEQDGMFATEGRREAQIMRVVQSTGYPVPVILWEEPDPSILGEPFFVMERVAGKARLDDDGLDDVLRSVRDLHALGRQTVDAVAAVDGLAAGCSPQQAIAVQLKHCFDVYQRSAQHPAPLLECGFAWLEVQLRPTDRTVIVHGDAGPGNALHDGSGIAAVIDWEFAHAGDPAEEWSYLALIRGRRIMSPEAWKERLTRVVGVTYDEPTWRAWELYNGVKYACINLTALTVFLRSSSPTPDHLAIGVAVHLRFLGRVVDLMGVREQV
jgi:aminoglycoside phosphotransferase (APT) family kinase protein